jgi:hypothetical protein
MKKFKELLKTVFKLITIIKMAQRSVEITNIILD